MAENITLMMTGIKYQLELDFEKSPELIWQLLTTNEGFQKWFPQISVGQLRTDGHLVFTNNGQKLKMPIDEYMTYQRLVFQWDSGTVEFQLVKTKQPGIIKLKFEEQLPFEFPNVAQDLAGWQLEFEWLRNAAAGITNDFNVAQLAKIEDHYIEELGNIGYTNQK